MNYFLSNSQTFEGLSSGVYILRYLSVTVILSILVKSDFLKKQKF